MYCICFENMNIRKKTDQRWNGALESEVAFLKEFTGDSLYSITVYIIHSQTPLTL